MLVLSIVTINFNNKTGLKNTLDSIASQSFTNFELIVVDAGSTDGSLELINLYDELITTKLIGQDTGIYNAMNLGIKSSCGDFIHILNSGDVYFSDSSLDSINFDTTRDFICFPVSKTTPKKYVWYPKVNNKEGFVDVAHPGLIVRHNIYLTQKYNERLKVAADSLFIYENVKPSSTDFNDLCMVIMQPGGISSGFSFYNEFEKQQLFWCYGYRKSRRLFYSVVSIYFFSKRATIHIIKKLNFFN